MAADGPAAASGTAPSPACDPAAASPPARAAEQSAPTPLPSALLSARVVVISDFNCPYCFTLNEWLAELGMASAVRWVGVEHKPHLPGSLQASNRPDDLSILRREVEDVSRRAPEVGVSLPPVWVNSRRALLLQAALEDEHPALAHRVRQGIFRGFWRHSRDIAAEDVLLEILQDTGLESDRDLDPDLAELNEITAWWARELDRIPCMLAPTGARHLGLQDRRAVEAFVLGALRDRPDGDGCR